MKWLVAAAGALAAASSSTAAYACDPVPPPFFASPSEVAFAVPEGEDYVVERDGVEVPGARRAEPSHAYGLDGRLWEYVVWVPDTPLDAGADYVLRASSAANGRTFQPNGEPAGTAPGGEVRFDFGSTTVPVGDEYCCYGDGNTCGDPSVCVSERRNTVAQVFGSVTTPNPAFVYRVAGADGRGGNDYFVGRFLDPATSYEVVVEAVDLRTGEVVVLATETFAADPAVAYGVADVDLAAEDLGLGNCPSPPSSATCPTGGTPDECPVGDDDVRAAWCAQNEECRERPGEFRCEFFADFCPDETGAGTGGPESTSDGCEVSSPQAAWPLAAVALLLALRRRRRRA